MNMTNALLLDLYLGFILLVVGGVALITPALTRRDIFFGVTVASGTPDTPTGRQILRRYRLRVAGITVLMLAAFALVAGLAPGAQQQFTPFTATSTIGIGLLVILLVFLLAVEGCYLLAYRASRALRAPEHAAGQDSSATAELRPRRYSDDVPWIWEVLPLAIILGTAIALVTMYDQAPAIIATHFDLAGRANAFARKTVTTYYFVVWMQIMLDVLLTGIAVLTVHSKAQAGAAQTRFRRTWMRYLYCVKLVVLAMLGVIGIVTTQAASTHTLAAQWIILPIAFGAVTVLAAVLLSLRTGQGGSRLDDSHASATDRMHDSYWFAGSFYVNRNDPSIFVEKRFGVGWTINFGNPLALLLSVGVIVGVVVLPLLLVGR